MLDLIAVMRTSGLEPNLRVEPGSNCAPLSVQLLAYRVVQEGLTNVRNHVGPGTQVWASVAHHAAALAATVRDQPSAISSLSAGREDPIGKSGHRLSILRTRLAGVAGQFAAGPHPDGGWQLSAFIPQIQQETRTPAGGCRAATA